MASSIENTSNFKERTEIDKAKKALSKARKLEEKRLSHGWRYIFATPHIQILVPCDKNGKPTAEGQRRIDGIINR
jgi:hypothetical protein